MLLWLPSYYLCHYDYLPPLRTKSEDVSKKTKENWKESDVQLPGLSRLRSNVEGKYLMDGVPFSCCNINSPRPCIQRHIANNSAHFNYEHQTEELNLWKKGCRQALLEYYTHIMQSIGLTVLIIWLFELSVLTGVRYLQTSLENVLRQGDPDSESDGWLLENSFMETARTNLNIIKSLSKNNHIDTANNGDPNINVPSTSKAHYGPDNVPPKQMPVTS
ncbi:photoreceptor outer segment membrane glycoprotein 2 [Scomber scombrus]|uniref:Photoreceptor outer segment membrane glycoprotein 2 n=1 Tax=Scomber scombrus TaxID=13677 RepID=A0AAV1NBY7_SCOSC